ncbi:plasmodesmata-located protein 7-like [Bidens hawaiensis]|uniref:plasmodesmata-located protein 7-like n=1 Tax=Bidens hawaiensis TaxID=980011 RepID=UPI00404A0F1D
MANTLLLLLLLLSLLFFLTLLHPSHSSTDAFIYGGCSQIKYTPGSPYESNLDSLLTSLVNSATYSSYNKYSISGSTQQDVINGLYQCRGDLAMPDCATCVARAVTQLAPLCPQACGGAVQLEGCFVKYDNTSFTGQEDKTVVMKKCAPSVGYDPEVMGRRDAVLTRLGTTGGLYRVGGSGDVEGVAQCVGDLSSGKCEDCVTEAIGRLKSDCGGAVFGDMFLAKCYARYSTSGAHAYAKSHHGEHDEAEKTFAIIVGLLAGVALIIIFLTFMRKAFGRHGK